jgi:hypothetical protein
MNRTCLAPLVALLVFAAATLHPAFALEKREMRFPDHMAEEWSAGATVTLAYYNICTGWLWLWGPWSDDEQVGVRFEPEDCSLVALLRTSAVLTLSPAPSGWGYTGTIAILPADDCSGERIASQPWVAVSGWTMHAWDVEVPNPFLLQITWGAPGLGGPKNVSRLVSDHPAAGPTGPVSCGTCFPATRESHTKYYGILGSDCPGVPLNDGICDVEALVYVQLVCPTETESRSWGKLKNLYQ